MSDKTLRQWAGDNNTEYWTAWRNYQDNKIPGAYKTATGRIFVKDTDPEQVIKDLTTQNTKNNSVIPTLKLENISLAATDTRVNKAADSPLVNRFSAIDEGIVPWVAQSGAYNRSSITVRDCIILCQKAFHNIGVFAQIVRLLVYLSAGNIHFKGGTKKSRKFFEAYFRKIGLDYSFQIQWFLEFWRSGNPFSFAYNKELSPEDVNQITNIYGTESKAAKKKKVTIPAMFTILNPADVQVGTYAMYIRPTYYQIIMGYNLEILKNPKSQADKDVFDGLPADAKDKIKKGARSVLIPLPSENLIACFYMKQPYEGLAIPPFFSVLDDINWKLQLRKMDIALTRMLNQAILLVTTGAKPDEGGINPNNITALQQIFLNESVGRVLIHDYTTKAEFIIPDIAGILDPKKYEAVNNDIYIGLNYILLQGEKFANKQTALQLFIENVKFCRNIFINDFLSKVIEKVSKELGFRSYPEPYFEEISLEKTAERDRIIAQLAQYGQLTPKEVYDALDRGVLPVNWDEVLENQQEFSDLKKKGMFQPILNNPKAQLDLQNNQHQNNLEMLNTKNEHDAKQKAADRKFKKDNPEPVAPQIHINAPKIKQMNGRPKGSTGIPQKTKNVRPVGTKGEILYSGAKLIETIKKYDSLEKEVISSLQTKFNISKLSDQQNEMASELSKIIARNEDVEQWNKESIATYIEDLINKKPLDKNVDRIDEIETIAAEFGLETYLASLLYNSKAENKLDKNENIE